MGSLELLKFVPMKYWTCTALDLAFITGCEVRNAKKSTTSRQTEGSNREGKSER